MMDPRRMRADTQLPVFRSGAAGIAAVRRSDPGQKAGA